MIARIAVVAGIAAALWLAGAAAVVVALSRVLRSRPPIGCPDPDDPDDVDLEQVTFSEDAINDLGALPPWLRDLFVDERVRFEASLLMPELESYLRHRRDLPG